jgi:hypothetical protein
MPSRIQEMSQNIFQQDISDIPLKVGIQLAKLTKVGACNQLLVFVQHVNEK